MSKKQLQTEIRFASDVEDPKSTSNCCGLFWFDLSRKCTCGIVNPCYIYIYIYIYIYKINLNRESEISY